MISGILGLNLAASFRSQRDQFSLRHERFARLILVWFVPVAGALLALFMLRKASEAASGKYPRKASIGDDYVTGFGLMNYRGYIKSPRDVFHSSSAAGEGMDD